MNESSVDMYIFQKGKFFRPEQIPFIREKLLALDDAKWSDLFTIKLKDPFIALMISFFGGPLGVDRMYLNKPLSGVCKLLVLFAFVTSYFFVMLSEDPSLISSLSFLTLCLIYMIWYIVDICNASRRAREINSQLIQTILN